MKKLEEMTVFIIGLGQIGGSIGMELIERNLVAEVVGFDSDRSVTTQAKRLKAVHRAVTAIQSNVARADIVILATPIRTVIEQIAHVAPHLKIDAICLDVAGTKREIMKAVHAISPPITYVSGHPMTGNEGVGLDAAGLGKFENTPFVLVANEHVSPEQIALIEQLVSGLGSLPVHMTADLHDRMVAYTSHLPYSLALALMHAAIIEEKDPAPVLQLISGSFRSATRVAKSSQVLTTDMLLTNRNEVVKAIDACVSELRHLQRMLMSKNESDLVDYANQAKFHRDKITE